MRTLDAPTRPEAPSIGTGTGLLEREQVVEKLDNGDHERFAHYVRKERILESALTGRPVIALCGKVWVPGRDPESYPICPPCKDIYKGLQQPNDGGGDTKNPGGGSGEGDSGKGGPGFGSH